MYTAKVFKSGNSQAVQIPVAFHLLTALPHDCLIERDDRSPQVC